MPRWMASLESPQPLTAPRNTPKGAWKDRLPRPFLSSPRTLLILKAMIACGLIALFGAFGQTVPSPSAVPWVLPMENTGETLHALVEESEWRKPWMTVVLDEPWDPPAERRIRQDDIAEDRYREPEHSRRKRIDEGWKRHGGVQVETEQGLIWVHQEVWELASRARKLAGVSNPASAPEQDARETATVDVNETLSTPETADAEAPGFFALWGTHLAIIAAAVVLLAFVVWTLVLT